MRASAASLLAAGLAGALLAAGPAAAQGSAGGQPRQLFPQPEAAPESVPGGTPGTPTPEERLPAPRLIEPAAPSESPAPGFGAAPPAATGEQRPPDSATGTPRLLPGRSLPSEMEGEGTLILRGGIEVDRLGGGGLLETAGPLEPGEGGLGLDLWAGSDRESLIRLLAAAPRHLESPALRDLARRLLLSSATPPAGRAGGSAPGALLRARADLLYDLGAFGGLRSLLERLPRGADTAPELARLRVETALLERDRAEACRQTRGGIEDFPQTAFWQETLIYCQISEGEEAAAGVGLALLREAGDGDPEIQRLAEAALGLGEPPEPTRAEALVLAYLALLDRAPSPALLQAAPPGMLPVLARQSRLEPELRLELAERAAAIGALPARVLAEAYERERFSAAELAEPLRFGREIGGARGRALLYKGAWRTRVPDERLAALEALLEAAAEEELQLAALGAAAPLLLELQPGAGPASASSLAVQALLLDGRYEAAAAWVAALRSAAEGDADARQAYAEIWPLARVAGVAGAAPLDLERWKAERSRVRDPLQVDRGAAMLRSLLDALDGAAVSGLPPLLSRVGGSGPPSPAALFGLRSAAAEGRRGETLLYALLLLGEGPPAEAHPQAVVETVGALAAIGLGTEARAVALETLIVQGL